MDDSFAFRTTVPLRRQLDPRTLRAAAVVTLVLLGTGLFANWVIASERRSLAAANRRGPVSDVSVTQIDSAAPAATDADAREAARISLMTAKAAFGDHRSFTSVGPSRLSELQPGYIFVDGPSTTAGIVSVASTRHEWAAAVMGPAGSCYWIRVSDRRWEVSRGADLRACTGDAALTSAGRGW